MAKRDKLEQIRAEFLSVRAAEALTGRSAWSWRKDCYAGRIGSVKLGRLLLIPRAEIDRTMRENLRPAIDRGTGLSSTQAIPAGQD
jgi:hypothetical protein